MLTALEDKAATEHAPRSPDRDVGSDDDESLYSVDSHGARIGPYTRARRASLVRTRDAVPHAHGAAVYAPEA